MNNKNWAIGLLILLLLRKLYFRNREYFRNNLPCACDTDVDDVSGLSCFRSIVTPTSKVRILKNSSKVCTHVKEYTNTARCPKRSRYMELSHFLAHIYFLLSFLTLNSSRKMLTSFEDEMSVAKKLLPPFLGSKLSITVPLIKGNLGAGDDLIVVNTEYGNLIHRGWRQ